MAFKKDETGKVIEFDIDRAKWLSGGPDTLKKRFGDGATTRMLDRQGRGCCLGLYADACGTRGMIRNQASDPMACMLPKQARWMVDVGGDNSDLANEMIQINDGDYMKPSDREKKLIVRFKKAGVKVNFIGEYPKAT